MKQHAFNAILNENTIIDGGSTALIAAKAVDTVDMVILLIWLTPFTILTWFVLLTWFTLLTWLTLLTRFTLLTLFILLKLSFCTPAFGLSPPLVFAFLHPCFSSHLFSPRPLPVSIPTIPTQTCQQPYYHYQA